MLERTLDHRARRPSSFQAMVSRLGGPTDLLENYRSAILPKAPIIRAGHGGERAALSRISIRARWALR